MIWRCTYGGNSQPRCSELTDIVVQIESGRLRPRCGLHAIGRVVSEEERNAYAQRRAVMCHAERGGRRPGEAP